MLFPALKGKEFYQTEGFKEIALIYGCTESSYRKVADFINRTRHQPDATPSRTLGNSVVREGTALEKHIQKTREDILSKNKFGTIGKPTEPDNITIKSDKEVLSDTEVFDVAKACSLLENDISPERLLKNKIGYENPRMTVNMSVDDVGVKKQKEFRNNQKNKQNEVKKKKERVQNTVVHVEHNKRSYVLNGYGVLSTLIQLTAFLLSNDLIHYHFLFLQMDNEV